ncbi:hypothetical protein GPECTOR_33g599 [Gonium pectorale]|uniref:Condensin complex subunit 2 n=1 Tax=Gonium pectorale TaxID=33097 RepID=A0A150GCZ6_GONPE|nr:hypothetical protein GPECTOR_33g599 [Gonium pectorale]|eukprot:KXZ47717.1 hypothetical protein GPECTOR_33g599 [Gonium pectorale]
MDDMDIDAMEVEVDQDRLRHAADKLGKRRGGVQDEGTKNAEMSRDAALAILKRNQELCLGNKITKDNAFDLKGIDALKILVFRDTSVPSDEVHFTSAGLGLDVGMRIYTKRVDAIYDLTYRSLGGNPNYAPKDDDEADDEAGRDQEGKEGTQNGEGEQGAPNASKARKRQTAASAENTLKKDSELKTTVKEPTFDSDPFFIRTSRLIDENSPQGLLLHNLPVLSGSDVVFNANIRQVQLPVNVSVVPGARELLAMAPRASLNPGIQQLVGLLQAETRDAPAGLGFSPEEVLRTALAENDGNAERMRAQRNVAVNQVLRQVEDSMDVDMTEADGGGAAAAYDDGGDGGDDAGYMPPDADDDESPANGYESPGYPAGGGRSDDDEDAGSGGGGGSGNPYGADRWEAGHGGRDSDTEAPPHGEAAASDDDSAMLSLLGAAASSVLTGGTQQPKWWKTRIRRVGSHAAPGAKPRVRRPRPEDEPIDWYAPRSEPQQEDVRNHTYKKNRPDATAKLLLPMEEPARPEDLVGFFSTQPAAAMLLAIKGPTSSLGSGRGGGGGGSRFGAGLRQGSPLLVTDVWRSVLLADNALARQRRRDARVGRPSGIGGASGATPGGARLGAGTGAGFPTASGTEGSAYGTGACAAEEYGADGGFNDYGDDGGAPDVGGGDTDDDEDEETFGAGPGGAAAGHMPSLEELLQPPRRVQRASIKFDKSAGVADVASLKANMEASLQHLAVTVKQRRRSLAPDAQPALSFQHVLDQVSAHVAATSSAAAKRAGHAAPAAVSGGGAAGFTLTGVSTHLAFICLLHLANEKGLALGNGGDMDTLQIVGLGDLATAAPAR